MPPRMAIRQTEYESPQSKNEADVARTEVLASPRAMPATTMQMASAFVGGRPELRDAKAGLGGNTSLPPHQSHQQPASSDLPDGPPPFVRYVIAMVVQEVLRSTRVPIQRHRDVRPPRRSKSPSTGDGRQETQASSRRAQRAASRSSWKTDRTRAVRGH